MVGLHVLKVLVSTLFNQEVEAPISFGHGQTAGGELQSLDMG